MNKQIKFKIDGKEYILEFTRETVAKTEESGFAIQKLEDMPVSSILKLFHGAFLCHFPKIKKDTTDDIYYKLGKHEELVQKLVEMLGDVLTATLGGDEGEEEKYEWGASW